MLTKTLAAALLACAVLPALAQEAVLRKNLAERMPNLPKIDEVRKTPIEGLYEVRFGTDVLYSDAEGNHLIQGQVLDTRTQRNLTEERINKLTAIDFASLPLKDAIVWKNGKGTRKIAVFADPNCGYCKRFERDLQAVKDVTVYTFLYPILSPDSTTKSRDIWCAKDRTKAWQDWMLEGKLPPEAAAKCETPLERNTALGRKHRVTGTPAIVFQDGTRVPGALNTEQIEQQLAAAASPRK
ncbi:DsbC family protein [Caldimonas tepidiphila]|uniref:DsbC family protein n=1 Tax=Caldimonas tepidiphila TaxID=2315841 RepID=UPI000E5A125D|nr:DsbC family protein [Caldimonas tepidiphila]